MKHKNLYLRGSVFLVILRLFLMLPVNARWIINRPADCTGEVSSKSQEKKTSVCYIDTDTFGNRYTSIEAALAVANDGKSHKVVVTDNTTIENDCVISKGVELMLPYSQSKIDFINPNDKVRNEADSASSNGPKLKLNVNLGTDYKSVNLEIAPGGILTIQGDYYGGAAVSTQGAYAQRTRKQNSKIIVDGTIRCFGFIKDEFTGTQYLGGNGSIIQVSSSGYVWEPLVVYDWPSGTVASNRYLDGVFPFQQFDRPNISAPLKILSGGTLAAQIQVYLKKLGIELSVNTTVNAIGYSGSLINLSTGFIEWNYGLNQKSQEFVFNRSNHLTEITCDGNASLGSLTLNFIGQTVDSSKCSIPRGPQFSVCVESGNFSLGNRSHWFGGNDMIVKKDGRVTITADTAVFDDVSVINNGVLSISGAIGGKVITGVKGSTLAIGKSTSITGKYLENGNEVEKTFTAVGYLSDNATNPTQLTPNSIYESALMTNKPSDGYWALNNNLYLIRYNLNEHVTVSDNVKKEMSKQRTRKYYDGAEEIQIVNPQDSELKRSYTTTTISGEGDNLTATTEEHSGYATFQGWNTNFYGAGESITPGGKYTFSQLEEKTGSHLIRLYDEWVGNKITIKFTYDEHHSRGSMADQSSSSCSGWKLPSCSFKWKWKQGLEWYSFDHWEIPSFDGKTVFSFSAETYILLDESIVDPTQNGFVLNVKAISK